jgi:tetratricopeptide (TPR) repeat protein
MDRVEKTVFLSYRRINVSWAIIVYQDLTHHGFDVFFDYIGTPPGDFEQVILGNIKSRAHFLVLLTPSAVERCHEPDDWLRREIETALMSRRNIVPLMLEGFDFSTPKIGNQLTGPLAALKSYNGLRIPQDYFDEGMERLRTRFLNVPLTAVLHPASPSAQQAAIEQKAAAATPPAVRKAELTAEQWFEQGNVTPDLDEQIRSYSKAIELKKNFSDAFYNRGIARKENGDMAGALQDFEETIRLNPNYARAFMNRGLVRLEKDDIPGALQDFDKTIQLKPDYAKAFKNRAIALQKKAENAAAIADYQRYLDLGGGVKYGDQSAVEESIRDLKKKL